MTAEILNLSTGRAGGRYAHTGAGSIKSTKIPAIRAGVRMIKHRTAGKGAGEPGNGNPRQHTAGDKSIWPRRKMAPEKIINNGGVGCNHEEEQNRGES